jgi:hypothetical protein
MIPISEAGMIPRSACPAGLWPQFAKAERKYGQRTKKDLTLTLHALAVTNG